MMIVSLKFCPPVYGIRFYLIHLSFYYLFKFWGGSTEAGTQGLAIARQVFYYLSHPYQPYFALVIFQIGYPTFFAQGQPGTVILLRMPPQLAMITGEYHHTQLVCGAKGGGSH
jgi:hypothetical protein